MRRRRRRALKRYSLAYLLNHQNAGFRKHPDYPRLIHYFDLSPVLKRLRITRRCYRILDKATLPGKNIGLFCRTYRLPKDPFFSLFLEIKRSVLDAKTERKRRKEEWIRKEMEEVPVYIKDTLSALQKREIAISQTGMHPVWNRVCIPKTKKHVNEMKRWNQKQWSELITEFINQCESRYSVPLFLGREEIYGAAAGEVVISLVLLRFPIPAGRLALPKKAVIQERYRKLSKEYHPDLGGDGSVFVLLKEARDMLLKK